MTFLAVHASEGGVEAPGATLFDAVVGAGSWRQADLSGNERARRIRAPGWTSGDFRRATHRFILDADASATLLHLATYPDYWLSVDLARVRLPSSRFWLEWQIDGQSGSTARQGMLISGDERGVSGSLIPFFQTSSGETAGFSAMIQFDWTQQMSPKPGEFGLRHQDHRCLNEILSHAVVTPIGSWSRRGRAQSKARGEGSRNFAASHLWHHFPMLCVFLAFLEHQPTLHAGSTLGETSGRASFGSRVPGSIAEKRVIYIGNDDVDLFDDVARKVARRCARRRASRAHAVRGHFVTRGATTYWRSSHVRGEGSREVAAKVYDVRFRRHVAE